jgi:hypothetical protein
MESNLVAVRLARHRGDLGELGECGAPERELRGVRRDGAPVGHQLSGVVEGHDPVAEQAPALPGMCGDDSGSVMIRICRTRAGGHVLAHGHSFPGIEYGRDTL